VSWKELGAVTASGLVDARLQLHHAALVVATAGVTFLEPQPDDSHPNLGWVDSLGALAGRPLPGADVQAALRLADLSLLIVDSACAVRDELGLHGRTLEDAYAWLAAGAAAAGLDLPAEGLARAAYDIPGHPVASGAAFSTEEGEAFAELGRWFANGQVALQELADRTAGASEVRCWPHHFDLGSLVVVATQPDGSLAKSIGLGLSPGDAGYAEPYWYVSPWPYPEAGSLPKLAAGGRWHTEGYTAAILTGSDLTSVSPRTQGERLHAFLDSAVDASQRILAR
jgi:hypothetical protein